MLSESVTCLECGKTFKRIDFHIKSHGFTAETYRKKYGAKSPLISEKILNDMSVNYTSPRSIQFYLNKGMNQEEAEKELLRKSKENSPFCVEFYLKRGYSEPEAKVKMKQLTDSIEYDPTKNANNTQYWITRGLNEEEARKKVFDLQSEKHQKYLNSMKNKGYSEEEALAIKNNKRLTTEKSNLMKEYGIFFQEKFNERRDTSSLASFQKRFGKEEGEKKYKEYWANKKPSHFSKEYYMNLGYSEKEAKEILSNKNRRDKAFFIKKYGEEDGTRRYDEFIKKCTGFYKNIGYSKVATNLFDKLKEAFADLEFKYASEEVKITDANGRNYFIDCVISNGIKSVAIEFNGDFWHANPEQYTPEQEILGTKASEIWEKDKIKEKLILEHFDNLLVVWESKIDFKGIENFIKGEFYENQY